MITMTSGPGAGAVIRYTQYNAYAKVGFLVYVQDILNGEEYSTLGYAVQDDYEAGFDTTAAADFENSFLASSFLFTQPQWRDGAGNMHLSAAFGYVLHDDNTATQILDASPNGGQPAFTRLWYWEIVDGVIVLTARIQFGGAGAFANCEPNGSNCMVFLKRYWMPVLAGGDSSERLHLIEWQTITSTFNPNDPQFVLNIAPRMQFYEKFLQDQDGDGVIDIEEVYDASADPLIPEVEVYQMKL